MTETLTLRQASEMQARARIVRAYVDCIASTGGEDFPLAQVAEGALVSERTVFRYYPSRGELADAAADWIAEHFFSFSDVDSLDDLPRVYRSAIARFEEHPHLAEVMVRSPRAGKRRGFRERVTAANREAIARLAPGLPSRDGRLALGIIATLDNVTTWFIMRDEIGLTSEEIGDAVEWAVALLIADLRTRAHTDE
jgi:AcrR family transcriptional regulator